MKSVTPLWLGHKGMSALELLRTFDIWSAPVPILEVARRLGVETHVEDMEEDGKVVMGKTSAQIFIPKQASYPRKRFTLAHELGHVMLHTFTTPHLDFRGQVRTSIEREADEYAADLLMPYWMVKFFGAPYKNNPSDLARMFGVSEGAMLQRLKDLGFVPGYRRRVK